MPRLDVRRSVIVSAEIGAFALATIVMTWPMILHLADRIADLGDPLFNAWVLPWTVHAVGTHPLHLFDGNIFYPEPNTLAYTDHMLAMLPVSAPAWMATHNGVFVNNLAVLVLVTLAGWSAYRLALEVTGMRGPAAVAGSIFAFSPYVFSHITQVQLLAVYTFPAVLLFGRRLIRRSRGRDAAGLAAVWILAVLTSWYVAVFLSIALVAFVGTECIVRRRSIAWRRLASLLSVVVVVVGVVVFVFSRPYVDVQRRYPQAVRSVNEAESYSATPRSILAAPASNVLYGDLTQRFRLPGHIERTLFVGLVPAILMAVALGGSVRRRRPGEVAPWVVVGGVMVVVALGPYFHWGRFRFPFPLLAVYELVPPLRFIRTPGRAFGVVMVAVAVLAAIALSRIGRPRLRAVACSVAVVVIGLEYASVPVAMVPAPRPSAAYRYLASSTVPGAVVELPTVPVVEGRPLPGAGTGEARFVYMSTAHWRPILNGYSGFFPPTHEEMVRRMQSFPSPSSLDFLRRRGVTFVAVHLSLLPGGPWERLAEGIRDPSLHLVVDDGEVRLYRLR